jgi:hypothetical protein
MPRQLISRTKSWRARCFANLLDLARRKQAQGVIDGAADAEVHVYELALMYQPTIDKMF